MSRGFYLSLIHKLMEINYDIDTEPEILTLLTKEIMTVKNC